MTVIELARIVQDMRQTQRDYFRLRTGSLLEESRQKERQLDKLIKEILDDQPALLPGMEE